MAISGIFQVTPHSLLNVYKFHAIHHIILFISSKTLFTFWIYLVLLFVNPNKNANSFKLEMFLSCCFMYSGGRPCSTPRLYVLSSLDSELALHLWDLLPLNASQKGTCIYRILSMPEIRVWYLWCRWCNSCHHVFEEELTVSLPRVTQLFSQISGSKFRVEITVAHEMTVWHQFPFCVIPFRDDVSDF